MNLHYLARRGFSLIELLVVIAIIGMLSTMILANMNEARKDSRDARRANDLKQIQTALELYRNRHGEYPRGGAGSDRPDWRNNTGATARHPLGALKDENLLDPVPVDPGLNGYVGGSGCGQAQFYAYWSNGQEYLLGAVKEVKGDAECEPRGNWTGPNGTNYTYQFVLKSRSDL